MMITKSLLILSTIFVGSVFAYPKSNFPVDNYVNLNLQSKEVNDLAQKSLAEIGTFVYARCTPLLNVKRIQEAKKLEINDGTTIYLLRISIEILNSSCALENPVKSCFVNMFKTSESDKIKFRGWNCE